MISVFSPLWFGILALCAALTALNSRIARGRERKDMLRFMSLLSAFVIVYWIGYKIAIANDPTYEFILIMELPLHLCNVMMIVALIASLTDCRVLQSFCFYFGTVGALLAMVTPDADFTDLALLSARGLGYWGYHMLVVVMCVSFVSTGVYKPKYKDILSACLVLLVFGGVMHIFNSVIRANTYPDVNYFYTYGIDGNPITELLHKLIPIDLVFMLPMLIPVGAVAAGMTWLARPHKKKEANSDK